MNVADKVLICLTEYFPGKTITPNTHLVKHLDADSLDVMEIVFRLEELFDINISENDFRDILYVKDLITHMEEQVK